jgi:hypothetical protein
MGRHPLGHIVDCRSIRRMSHFFPAGGSLSLHLPPRCNEHCNMPSRLRKRGEKIDAGDRTMQCSGRSDIHAINGRPAARGG